MTGNLDSQNASTKWLPDSSIQYTRMSKVTDWWQGYLKYQVPKSVRRKILIFVFIVAVCCIMLIYSCFNCYIICSGTCNVLNIKPDLLTQNAPNVTHLSSISQNPKTSQRLPSCIIIGVRKAGTRALLQYLGLHPNIAASAKEQHFFNTDKYKLGLNYYRKEMPPSLENQITLEKTPAYFSDLMTPERIYRMNSSIKLLMIVREPVTRLISDYTQLKFIKEQRNKEMEKFEDLVLDENQEVNADYRPIQRSIYYHYFINWLEFFSLDQIHITNGDALITNPYPELYNIETFLGIPHKFSQQMFYFNASKGFFCINEQTLETPCLSDTKGRPHPRVDPEVLEKLYEFYRPRNKIFFNQAKQTFDWP